VSKSNGTGLIPAVEYGAKSSPDERESVADQLRIVREAIDREGGRRSSARSGRPTRAATASRAARSLRRP
jgi:hypothetical protein